MPKRWVKRSLLGAGFAAALCMAACHADDDDPKGQAEELHDSVRREHAMGRLQAIFGKRLAEAKGDRSAAPIKEFTEQTVADLVKVYLEHPEDSGNRLRILGLLQEMRDARALPALMSALEWRTEVSEEHAVTATRTLRQLELSAADKSKAVEAIAKALDRVQGARGLDNRMRQSFVEALGMMKDKAGTDSLVKVMLSQDSNQNFLFNILAAQQLIGIADEKAVPALIKALYITDPNNPAMRMNDVAASALVAIGRPALQPVVEALEGKSEVANATAKLYIETVRQKDRKAAESLKVVNLVTAEAGFTLGKLGFREAVAPLIVESKNEDLERAFSGAIALVSINRSPKDTQAIVDSLTDVYRRLELRQRPQMLVAMRHLYADEAMGFLRDVATTSQRDLPAVQMYGFVSYAMLADKSEVKAIKAVPSREPMLAPHLKPYQAVIAAANTCDRDVTCWIGKLSDKDKVVVRKAANMLARFARGNTEAIGKLVELLGHKDLEVRNEVLYAVDYMATDGSQVAVDKIDALQDAEEGRSIWSNFKREALPARARLAARL